MIALVVLGLVVAALVARRYAGVKRRTFNDHHHFEPATRSRLGSSRRETL